MKKASKKRVIVSVVLAALLFAAAITAYAVSWHESGHFSGSDYSGDYTATMDLTADHASASLSVSNYTGVAFAGGGAKIEISTSYEDGTSNSFTRSTSTEFCSASDTATEPSFISLDCRFNYMNFFVTSHTLDLG